MLRVSDPRVFDEIRAVVSLEDHLLGWISPTEAVVDPMSLRMLLDALEARGMRALVKKAGAGFSSS